MNFLGSAWSFIDDNFWYADLKRRQEPCVIFPDQENFAKTHLCDLAKRLNYWPSGFYL